MIYLCLLLGQVPARFVLYLLSWSGFLVSFMMRTDINLAIVAMVEDPKKADVENVTEQYCYEIIPSNSSIEDSSVVLRFVKNY